jgi:hypothetical protein
MFGLAKLAASFDARRSKQYWQLLKRLHGGGEEAVKAIKETGDSGIYHGTIEQNMPGIMENGLHQGYRGLSGKGQYFGTKNTADFYATNSHGTPAMVRMKKPSELSGTENLYPANHAAKMDFNDHSIMRAYGNKASKSFHDTHRNEQMNSYKTFFSLPSNVRYALERREQKGLLNNSGKYMQARNQIKKIDDEAYEIGEKSNPFGDVRSIAPEMHKFRYYGKSPNPHLEDAGEDMIMFHNQPNIPSSLLTQEKMKY